MSPDALAFLTECENHFSQREAHSDPDLSWDCRPVEFLRIKKTLKFMSKQDRLAVSAAGKAIRQAGDSPENLQTGCGVFMAVGYIPFRIDDATEFCQAATENGRFSMKKFSTDGFDRINPLLAFSCLPNMPAHHVSANFDLRGEYFVTYPGAPQFCLALEEAIACLAENRAQSAIVGGVADQTNFLVENHYKKACPNKIVHAADAAAFIFIEPEKRAIERNAPILARLISLDVSYSPEPDTHSESDIEFGPADLPAKLCVALNSGVRKSFFARGVRKSFFATGVRKSFFADFTHGRKSGNYSVKSRWRIP